jgi:hypothetical protein
MFGQLLIDPNYREVMSASTVALGVALGAATSARPALPAEMREELPGVFKTPEGWQVWKVNPQAIQARVGVAWWSDPTGRRHVRVGGAARLNDAARRFFAEWPGLTPLARVHPGRCYLRHVAREPRLVVACDCGLNGLPDVLNWMGPCCGPCFDRHLEAGRDVFLDSAALPASHVDTGEPAHVVAVAPDGTRIATAIHGQPFRVWDVTTGREMGIDLGACAVHELHFSADGNYLAAVCSLNHSLAVWDLAARRRVLMNPAVEHVTGLQFAGDLLLASTGQQLHIWEVASGRLHYTGQRRHQLTRLAASPAGFPVVLSHASEHELLVLRSATEQAESIRAPSLYPSALAVSAEGRFIAARESAEPAIKLYDLRDGRWCGRIKLRSGDIRDMAFAPHNSRRLVTAGSDGLGPSHRPRARRDPLARRGRPCPRLQRRRPAPRHLRRRRRRQVLALAQTAR